MGGLERTGMTVGKTVVALLLAAILLIFIGWLYIKLM